MGAAKQKHELWVLGGFDTPEAVLEAAGKLRDQELGELDIYSNYPLHGAEEVLRTPKSKVPLIVFGGGMTGLASAVLMQWWMNAHDYALNVGGRPLLSWPQWVPVTFELGVLLAAFGAFFGLWALLRLPRLHHPVFEVEAFRSAQVDRFWLSVMTHDLGKKDEIEAALKAVGAADVASVEHDGGE
jgi:hypothetical protein